jgi:hypothetical protein
MLWFKKKEKCPQCGKLLSEPIIAMKGDTVTFAQDAVRGGITRTVYSDSTIRVCTCGYWSQEETNNVET